MRLAYIPYTCYAGLKIICEMRLYPPPTLPARCRPPQTAPAIIPAPVDFQSMFQ
jgi:hypothetical protein